MSPTKILLIVVILAFLGLAALAFQLTKGVSDSESSTELQEAMPALQSRPWGLKLLMIWKKLFFAGI